MRLNCLVKNSPLIGRLQNFMMLSAANIQAGGTKASFNNVYNAMRKQGIEIDLQSTALLYANTFNLNDSRYSTQAQVDALSGKTFDRIVKVTHSLIKLKEIKGDSPAVAVAAALFDTIVPRVGSVSTVQKTMQDRLFKWAKNKLELRGVPTQTKSFEATIKEALSLEISQPIGAKAPIGIYGMLDTADALQNQLKQEFQDLTSAPKAANSPYDAALMQHYADVLSQLPYTLMLSSKETKDAIQGSLKEAGYTKTIDTKSGPKEVVDWRKVIQDNPNFRTLTDQVFTDAKGYTAAQRARINQSLEQDYRDLLSAKKTNKLAEKNKQATDKKDLKSRTASDRLYELYDLGAFQAAQQDALMQLLGVDVHDIGFMRKVEDVIRLTKMGFQNPITQWSNTYNRTIRRAIERQVSKLQEKHGGKALKAIRTISYLEQLNAGYIISNYQNVLQNLSSAFVEGIATMLQDPKHALHAINTFSNVWLDVVSGGVRVGVEKTNIYDVRGSVEDLFNIGNAHSTKEWTYAVLSQLNRTALSAADAGAKASLIHMHVIRSAASLLVKANTVNGVQKLTQGQAALIVNHAFYNNLSSLNGHAQYLTDTLYAAKEIRNKRTAKKRIAEELALQNLFSGGNTFNLIIDKLIQDGDLQPGNYVGLNEKTLRSVEAAANAAAARGLGHESDFELMRNTIDRWHVHFAEKIGRVRGDKRKTQAQRRRSMAAAEAQALTFAKVMRFMGGQLRWVALTAVRGTGLVLGGELLYRGGITVANKFRSTDKLKGGLDQALLKNVELDLNDEKGSTEALTFHMALRARLARETVGFMLSYFVGYQIILPYMLQKFKEAFKDDDDDEETKQAKAYAELSKWINEDNARKRWVMMSAPLAVFNYMDMQLQGNYGKYSIRKDSQLTEPELLDMIDPVFAFRGVTMQWQPNSTVQLLTNLQKESKKTDPDYAKIGYKYFGDFFNITGWDKMLNTNKNAYVSGGQMGKVFFPQFFSGTPQKGETTNLTSFQKSELEPHSTLESIMQGAFSRDTYAKFAKKDISEIAPVAPKIIAEWKDSGDIDFLPPTIETSVEFTEAGDKYKFEFDEALKGEFIGGLKQAYRDITNQYVQNNPNWENQSKADKLADLKELYDIARKEFKEDWIYKYDVDRPDAAKYWTKEEVK